jgi:hypothetical protein
MYIRGSGGSCADTRNVNIGDLGAKKGDLETGSEDVMWVTFSSDAVPNQITCEGTGYEYRSGCAWELQLNTFGKVPLISLFG